MAALGELGGGGLSWLYSGISGKALFWGQCSKACGRQGPVPISPSSGLRRTPNQLGHEIQCMLKFLTCGETQIGNNFVTFFHFF